MTAAFTRGDTIFALASGVGRAAVAVVRISGPRTGEIVSALCALPPSRRLALRILRHADEGGEPEVLDHALVAWLPGPKSYTGEDQAELHLHGGRAVASAVARALVALGARPAEPGEFTRRSFLNGRLDLLEAESVADLIDAQTDAQRRQAMGQLEGRQSRIVAGWRERLLRLLGMQEALIDFPEEDLPPEVERSLLEGVLSLRREIDAQLVASIGAEKLRTGLSFAIVGAPNVGKSSLINWLVASDVAIVSPTPGTTRDAIEITIELVGVPVTLVDTAGLRETADPVEAEGVRRARAWAERADLVLHLVEAGSATTPPATARELWIGTKVDLTPAGSGLLGISVVTGEGLAVLLEKLGEHARALAGVGANPVLNNARHRAALAETSAALKAAHTATAPEIRGEELRGAMQSLGRIAGVVGVETLLGDIFGRFCIGK